MPTDSSPTRPRELLLASPVAIVLDDAAEETATATAPEGGHVDLSRLCLFAAAEAAAANQVQVDLLPLLRVTSILFRNRVELVRGAGTVRVPGGVFSPLRQHNPLRFGTRRMEATNTLDVSGIVDATGMAGNLSLAVPFIPDGYVHRMIEDVPADTPCSYAGSPEVTIAAAASGDAVIEFDEAGIFDLDSLQIIGSNDPAAGYVQDVVPAGWDPGPGHAAA